MRSLLTGPQAVAHLLRRAEFAPSSERWQALRERPYDEVLAAVVEGMRAPPQADPPKFDPYVPGAIQQLWLERLCAGAHPAAERLALLWHGHFATSDAKIQNPALMWQQHRMLREHGAGPFAALLAAVARDPAMIRFLDGNSNRKGNPNENFAREVQELFVLGIGNYTEGDVREVARAFTGWGSSRQAFVYEPTFHDDGEKTIHEQVGSFGGDEALAILLARPAAATHIARKLLVAYAHERPPDDDVAWLADVLRENEFDIAATLETLFASPPFLDAQNEFALVRGPIAFVAAAWRLLGLVAVPTFIHGSLDRMGQILFRPPSVKGWTSGPGWLTSGALVERFRVAAAVADLAPLDRLEAFETTVFAGTLPSALGPLLEGARGRDRVARLLASPDFQLA